MQYTPHRIADILPDHTPILDVEAALDSIFGPSSHPSATSSSSAAGAREPSPFDREEGSSTGVRVHRVVEDRSHVFEEHSSAGAESPCVADNGAEGPYAADDGSSACVAEEQSCVADDQAGLPDAPATGSSDPSAPAPPLEDSGLSLRNFESGGGSLGNRVFEDEASGPFVDGSDDEPHGSMDWSRTSATASLPCDYRSLGVQASLTEEAVSSDQSSPFFVYLMHFPRSQTLLLHLALAQASLLLARSANWRSGGLPFTKP